MPRISNTNGRRMVALDLTPREQRGPYEMHDNFSPIDPPHPNLAGWALQVAISAGGDAGELVGRSGAGSPTPTTASALVASPLSGF